MPLWVRTILMTGPLKDTAAAAEGHREHLRALRAEGRLRLAGEIGKGDGFLEVFEAKDRRQAEATAAESPLVSLGLSAWTLRPFRDAEL